MIKIKNLLWAIFKLLESCSRASLLPQSRFSPEQLSNPEQIFPRADSPQSRFSTEQLFAPE